jgi:hypothetical protein
MKSKQITVNGIEITANEDGSIDKPFYGKTKRTFGGTHGPNGYLRIRIGDKRFLAHSLIAQAFLADFNDFPQVDHIDGDKANNNPSNLRMVTSARNHLGHLDKKEGCSSQYRGVTWSKLNKKWKAQCSINKKPKYLGLFDSECDAAIARDTYAFSQGFALEGLNFPENYAYNIKAQ